jgi:uncharacterized membrane protein
MRGHRDLAIAVRAAVLCAVLALLLPGGLPSLIFAAPLALLPGFAIASATFVRRPLGRAQLLALSLALSLMTLALGGLPLNYMPGGIRAFSWALLLVLIVVAGCRIAALRRPRPPIKKAALAPLRVSRPEAAMAIAGLALAVAALVLAFTTLPAKNALGYSELWMLPSDDVPAAVEVGVISQEKSQAQFRLRVTFANRTRPIEREFSLDPAPPLLGTTVAVNASLYLQGLPGEAYRRVSGQITAPEASP